MAQTVLLGEKAGKLLAWRTKKIQSDEAINSIQMSSGRVTVDPVEINDSFREYYHHLYKSECPENIEERNSFLNQLQFPQISDDAKKELDNRLTTEELSQAIQNIHSGKTPGPDGLPI